MNKHLHIRIRNFSASALIIAVTAFFISNKSILNEGTVKDLPDRPSSKLDLAADSTIDTKAYIDTSAYDEVVSTLEPIPLDEDYPAIGQEPKDYQSSESTKIWETQYNNDWPAFTLDDRVSYFAPVTLNTQIENSLIVSETVSILLPEQKQVEATIKSVRHEVNGDISWQGYVDGHDDKYPVTYTQGKTNAFATITTPEGSYTMETVNGSGWVYLNPSSAELSSPGSTDYLIPGQ